jgi:putative addiction module antidote
MITLKLRAIGTSTGFIIPKDLLSQIGWKEGEEIIATPTRDGLTLSHFDPEVARQVAMGEEFMDEYKETFRELAK